MVQLPSKNKTIPQRKKSQRERVSQRTMIKTFMSTRRMKRINSSSMVALVSPSVL
jgi:hypothetical protein